MFISSLEQQAADNRMAVHREGDTKDTVSPHGETTDIKQDGTKAQYIEPVTRDSRSKQSYVYKQRERIRE